MDVYLPLNINKCVFPSLTVSSEEVNMLNELIMTCSLGADVSLRALKDSDRSAAAVTSANAWQLHSSICMMGGKASDSIN